MIVYDNTDLINRLGDDDRLLRERLNVERESSRYHIEVSDGERDNPDVVMRAQQIHGLCYTSFAGYFKPSGLDRDGRLIPELDSAREDDEGRLTVQYLVARRNDGERISLGDASMRVVGIGPNGSLEDLPTYKYARNNMSEEAVAEIENVVGIYGKSAIKEIAALSSENWIGNIGSYELMRAVVQDLIIRENQRGDRELYLTSLTDTSLGGIVQFSSPSAVKIIGDRVKIFHENPHAHDIWVTPVLVDPSMIVDGTVKEIEMTPSHTYAQDRIKHLKYLIDGLPNDFVSIKAKNLNNHLKHVS